MKVCTEAEFRADVPDDVVFDGDDVVVSPGRALAEIIAGMLTRLGYQVAPPIDVPEHGWELDVTAGGRRIWLQVTQGLGETPSAPAEGILMVKELPTLFQRLFRRSQSIQAELVIGLHREMRTDARFSDIRWWRDYYRQGRPADQPVISD